MITGSTSFKHLIEMIFGQLRLYENDPGFGFRIYAIPEIDEARIFRLGRKKHAANDEAPPTKGVFVQLVIQPTTNKLIMAFKCFPKDGGESELHAALAYDVRELRKGYKHIVDWLTFGMLPEADGQFADGAQHELFVSSGSPA